MYFKPHILQKKLSNVTRDEYGRIVADNEEWIDLGHCRCDDNTQQEFRTDNGIVYRPQYHIVAEGDVDVHAGDEVRCLINKDAYSEEQPIVRGEGKVYQAKHLNKLQYTDIWV